MPDLLDPDLAATTTDDLSASLATDVAGHWHPSQPHPDPTRNSSQPHPDTGHHYDEFPGADEVDPRTATTPAPRVGRPIDLEAAKRAVGDLLVALGQDTSDAELFDTPRRVADAYTELLTPTPFSCTTFPNDGGYDELVIARSIPMHSLCAHHLLPFIGVAHVAYLPGERIVGLSKLARVVDHFSRRLQNQERLTTQVADWLCENLAPKGVGVLIEAEHLCMSLRGIQAAGTHTVTSAVRGKVRDDPRTRAEFLALARGTTQS